jgi:hypothetical protein
LHGSHAHAGPGNEMTIGTVALYSEQVIGSYRHSGHLMAQRYQLTAFLPVGQAWTMENHIIFPNEWDLRKVTGFIPPNGSRQSSALAQRSSRDIPGLL